MPAYFVGGVARKKCYGANPTEEEPGRFFGVDYFQWRQA
jgi:hypothetical protein